MRRQAPAVSFHPLSPRLMQLNFTAGGPKLSAIATLQSQRATQVATQPAAQEVADAVLAHVDQELVGVPDEASVSVSVSVWIGVSKPALQVE